MKALVLGGSGLVGRYLVPRLIAGGCAVDVGTRRPTQVLAMFPAARAVSVDLAGTDWLTRSGLILSEYDVVYHLAYETHAGEDRNRIVTVDSVRSVVAALRGITDRRERHFVYTGSMVVFGARPANALITEASPRRADDAYARNKIDATSYALDASDRLLCTVIHPTGVYAERSERIEYYRNLLRRNYVPGPTGEGGINNIVYADDVAQALHRCLARPRTLAAEEYIINGEVLLFAQWFAGLATTVTSRTWLRLPRAAQPFCRGVARRALNRVGVSCPLPFFGRPTFEQRTTYSSEKARTHFGYVPQTVFADVCRRLQIEQGGKP